MTKEWMELAARIYAKLCEIALILYSKQNKIYLQFQIGFVDHALNKYFSKYFHRFSDENFTKPVKIF